MNHLDSLFDLKYSIAKKEPKEVVRKKFFTYIEEYDKLEEPTIADKIRHREIFFKYISYVNK